MHNFISEFYVAAALIFLIKMQRNKSTTKHLFAFLTSLIYEYIDVLIIEHRKNKTLKTVFKLQGILWIVGKIVFTKLTLKTIQRRHYLSRNIL